MITLTGNSLSERHQQLNSKVNEAALNAVSFDDVKSQKEKTDIDRLFKIDLANKYKNLDYIIETLKCGDSVYITRALKCTWLYSDELSHMINPDHLEQHVFPEMSFKMKRKFLKLISQHVTNSERAALFCTYCIKNNLPNIALKFLWYSPEQLKVDVIKEHKIYISDDDVLNIIGNSFAIATTVLGEANKYSVGSLLKRLCYLYSVSDVEYLDLVEKYLLTYDCTWPSNDRIGLRLSKNIIKNHKNRLFCRPNMYINMLNKKMLMKYSTADDVKKYLENLRYESLWDFYREYEYILEVIPSRERLQYLREAFKKHHPTKQFEMSMDFYHAGLYKLMTNEERENWALEHIKNGLEHFGHGKDFIWYKFVSFDKAYEPIKKYILIAANGDVRSNIVNILVSSAKSDRELEALFNYYYQRFVNEMISNKQNFIDEVISIHDYYKFDEGCWQAFDKILHSMDVYDDKNAYSCRAEYKLTAIIYAILHKIELHQALKQHINDGLNLYLFKQHTDKLPAEKVDIVYHYVFNFYLEKINNFNIEEYDENVKFGVRTYVHNLLELMIQYGKSKKDIPEVVMNLIMLDREEYKYNALVKEEFPFTQLVLIKDLKKDASLVVSKLSLLKEELEKGIPINLAVLLKKLKIYFSTDVALKCVELFKEILTSDELREETYSAAVFGLFHLAEYTDKDDLVSKYVPTEPKIDHVEIERKILYIRKAICKFVCISRPIISLSKIQKYVSGDYLKFCLPMFQSYAANLQPAALKEFVKFLLKSPASVQKHGIRLVFECFSIHDSKSILTEIWKKTKNVSLRLIMYKQMYQRFEIEHEEGLQKEILETLKFFTLDVREDDDDEMFAEMNKTQLPRHVIGEHILSVWQVLNTLPNKEIMFTRKSDALRNMAAHLKFMQQDAVDSIVREHIKTMLTEKQMQYEEKTHIKEFFSAKWNLTAKYLMYLPSQDILEHKLKIIETLVKECIKLWNDEQNRYVFRGFLVNFITILGSNISYDETSYCLHGVVLLKKVLKDLLEALPLIEIYDTIWYLQLSIITANTIVEGQRASSTEQGDSNNYLTFDEYIDKFAKEVVSLLNKFIADNKWYASALGEIYKFLDIFSYRIINNWPEAIDPSKKECQYVFTVISSRLVEIEKFETYKFALELLPTKGGDPDMRHATINKIKSFNNDDISYYCYKKFEVDYYVSVV